jgi:hypothetical protein
MNCSLEVGAWMQTGEEITVNTNQGIVSAYTLGLYYSGRQSQQSFYYYLLPLTHYMYQPVRAIIRRIFSLKLVIAL